VTAGITEAGGTAIWITGATLDIAGGKIMLYQRCPEGQL
jgi:hypothetical protein